MSTPELTADRLTGVKPPRYRLDIQGLRAVAVLLVVAFHTGLPIPGGFVGVDVFFVISGYVITNMLFREWDAHGRISLRRFWRRRFFRLAPALSLVVAFTFILSALLLYPQQQTVAYQTGIGAILFVANIVVARNTGGYFDPPAELNPLLNTWSLSVEEQFYALFPFILLVSLLIGRRMQRRLLLPFVSVAAIAVLSLTLALASATPLAEGITWLNFYSPVTRAWEFAVGSLLAFLLFNKRQLRARVAKPLRWVGGISLALSAFAIGPTTPFPGPWTLLPVSATLLLLLAGHSDGPESRMLTHRILVRVGDWSYSIYLWHWPMIAFAIVLGIDAPIWLLGVALLSFIPAIASYRFVEQPLRMWSPQLVRKRILVAGAVILIPILLVPMLIVVATPVPRYTGNTGLTYLDAIFATSHNCNLQAVASPTSRCFQSQSSGDTELLIIGDSHAEDLYLGFTEELPDLNVEYVYLPGWPYGDVLNAREVATAAATNTNLRAVIVNARWDEYTAGDENVLTTLRPFIESGVPVFLGNDRPKFTFHAEQCQYQPILGPRAKCSASSQEFDSRYEKFMPILRNIEAANDNVFILNTADGYCADGSCSMLKDGNLVFADSGHLNEMGSQEVATRVLQSDDRLKGVLLGRAS